MDLENSIRNNIAISEDVSEILKQTSQYYREENSRMEQILLQLSLMNEELKMVNSVNTAADGIQRLLKNSEVDSPCVLTTALSQVEKQRKHSNYLAKVKTCIKFYITLNVKLSKEIQFLKSEQGIAQKNVNGILNLSTDEIKQLNEKIKRYERELSKFEVKYPWIKDPKFDLPNISKEIDVLQTLRLKKDELQKELDVYQGLSPDLKEATHQLELVKMENTKLSNMLLNSQK